MKLIFILFTLLSYLNVYTPIHKLKFDSNTIQNTNLNFKEIDFEKLEVAFYQVGCYNHDRYRLNFKKGKEGYYIKLYGYSTKDCEEIKLHLAKDDKLMVVKFLKNEQMDEIKNILVTDQTEQSTMNNGISIKYNEAVYDFYDNSVSPKWQAYFYKMMHTK